MLGRSPAKSCGMSDRTLFYAGVITLEYFRVISLSSRYQTEKNRSEYANDMGYPISSYDLVFNTERTKTLYLAHVNHASYAITLLHNVKGGIDVVKRLSMRDEFVHLQFTSQVIVDQIWQLRAALDTAKCTSFPYSARDQLESCSYR